VIFLWFSDFSDVLSFQNWRVPCYRVDGALTFWNMTIQVKRQSMRILGSGPEQRHAWGCLAGRIVPEARISDAI
jgi:hypothetical protein